MIQSLLDTYLSLPLLVILFIPILLLTLLLGAFLFARMLIRVGLNKSRKVTVIMPATDDSETSRGKRKGNNAQPEQETVPTPTPSKRNQFAPLVALGVCILFLLWHFGVFEK